jgi:hypothetical protein
MNGNGYCIHLLIQCNIIERQEISLTLGVLRELRLKSWKDTGNDCPNFTFEVFNMEPEYEFQGSFF